MLNIDWQQILLHLLNFAILALGLYLLLYKPVKKFMAKRKDHYQQMDDEARQKLEQARNLEDDYKMRLQNAEIEIDEKKAKAIHETEEVIALQIENAKEQCNKLISEARDTAQKEHERMLEDVGEEITEMAIIATEKILSKQKGDAYDQFLAAAEKRNFNNESKKK